MIYDTIQNTGLYKGIGKRLDLALAYMAVTEFSGLAAGRHDIDGDKVYVIIQQQALRRLEDTAWEAHRKYADIQFALSAGETIACAPDAAIDGWEAYSAQTDFLCSHSRNQGVLLPMKPGTFAVFFPHDAHRPLIGEGNIRKAVIKVLVERQDEHTKVRE